MDSDSNNSKGSFAWTDASDDASDSDIKNNSMGQSAEESESEKSFKKNLQKDLFPECEKLEDCNPKKRKLTKQDSTIEDEGRPKKKKIKNEPESDIESGKMKRKHTSSVNTSHNSSNEDYDESYLDQKVKDEQYFAVPTPNKIKKKKSKSLSITNDISIDNGDVLEHHVDANTQNLSSIFLQYEDSPVASENDLTDNSSDILKTRKKKTKTKDVDRTSYMEVSSIRLSDDDDVQFTVINPSVHKKNKNKKKSKKIEITSTNGNITDDDKHEEYSHVSKKDPNTKSKLSDRLTFEDDIETDENNIITNSKIMSHEQPAKSTKLQKFVQSSKALRSLNPEQMCAQILTDDDDLWVVRCPKDLPVDVFQDKKWILGSKYKIKLEGQTYEGSLENKKANITIVGSDSEKFIIKNISVNGYIRLRRRIPKSHIPDDNEMNSTQTNFIPLPDTKCRHPLLGINYKKAMKLPTSVAEKLKQAGTAGTASTEIMRRKKRHRKIEYIEDNVTSTTKIEPLVESEQLSQNISKKKKKKRKHSEAIEECSEPRSKKRKHDPKSAETWDSEKAIEETLFSF